MLSNSNLLTKFLLLLIHLSLKQKGASGIVNRHPETANPIFYRRIPLEFSEQACRVGLLCLESVTKFYLIKPEKLTRSHNVVVASAVNMSTPAAEIQDSYLELMNRIVEDDHISVVKHLYQLRVISDSEPYDRKSKQPQGALLLADYYVIVTDSVERLINLIQNSVSRMISWNPGARFLVLFNDAMRHRDEEDVIMEIYTEMQTKFYIHRITILYAINALDYSLTSLDYFNKKACRKIIPRSFGFCRNGTLDRHFDKLQREMEKMQSHDDSMNCTFNVCASISAPFVERDCDQGLELRIIGFIRNRLRLNINLNCDRTNRGVPKDNDEEKWTGLLGRLQLGTCDFIIGGYYPDNEVLSHFWVSDCYFDDKHTWFIKLSDERPAWMALYSIFDKQAWLCFIGMLPITWLSWYFLMQLLPEPKPDKEFSLIGMNNMALTLCVAVNERPLCYAVRIFWFALSLYGMNIVAIYTSRLIAVFANPGYLHQIDNLQEVIAEGLEFGGYEECRDWFENDEDMWIYERYNDTDLFVTNSSNLETVAKGQRVILTSRMYVVQSNVSDLVYGFPSDVFSSPVQMIMKPGFPFMMQINKLIRYMRDMGIFEKYMSQFLYNNTYLSKIARKRPEMQEPQIVIRTEHLQGCFALLILGLSCSCFVFCLELRGSKRNKKAVKRKRRLELKKKKKKRLKKSSKTQAPTPMPIKTKHTTYQTTKANPKYAAVQEKFGKTNNMCKEQIRFTPVHRRNILKSFNEIANVELRNYSHRTYY